MAERDSETASLIERLLRLEAEPWPAALDEYSQTLLALGMRCEAPPALAEFEHWLSTWLPTPTVPRQRAGWASLVTRAAGLFLRARAGLHPNRRPDLRAMLRRQFHEFVRTHRPR